MKLFISAIMLILLFILDQTAHAETAKVDWFNSTKGFGFATLPTGKKVFITISELEKAGLSHLEPGDMVNFTIGTNDYGKEEARDIHYIPAGTVSDPVAPGTAQH